jgi:hypothetical protein
MTLANVQLGLRGEKIGAATKRTMATGAVVGTISCEGHRPGPTIVARFDIDETMSTSGARTVTMDILPVATEAHRSSPI